MAVLNLQIRCLLGLKLPLSSNSHPKILLLVSHSSTTWTVSPQAFSSSTAARKRLTTSPLSVPRTCRLLLNVPKLSSGGSFEVLKTLFASETRPLSCPLMYDLTPV